MNVSTGARLGPYEILALLGAGGMGEVYRARDTRLGREVAVKVLPERFSADEKRLRRFEQEARAAGALDHPNVLVIHDVGSQDGTPYVVSELLEGQTLRERLQREPRVELDRVLDIALQTVRGLAAAHEKGIVHRDLKPENLFLTRDRRLKILDFGLAKLLGPLEPAAAAESQTTATRQTDPGTQLGTIGYMAPEQVRGEPADRRSDIFSFGAVLYELASGQRAFPGATASDTLAAILRDEPPDLSRAGAPAALARIVSRCLEKSPEARFHSAHDLALALEALTPERAVGFREEATEERGPYPGLASFSEKDAENFFGREVEVAALWQKLRTRRLLALIGPSGAGKTSFVRAGVVARHPEGWAAIVSTPGTHPFRNLARALAPQLRTDPEALPKLLSFDEPDTALELLQSWRKGQHEALLVVDQFEELFTLNPRDIQARFAELLGRASAEAGIHVLVSIRDDFLIRCCESPALAPVLSELTALLALRRENLLQALVEPAKREGFHFEDEALVEEMLAAVEGERGALPPLAFAVARLWEKRDRGNKLLTRAAYTEIGGVAGALAQHAEATLERIGSSHMGTVRELFRNLVTAQGTRVVCDRDELLSAFPDRPAAEQVLRQLVDARLLTSYEIEGPEGQRRRGRIEVVHESLLKAWPRLVRWQAQDEDGAVLRDQLKQAARLWEEKGRTPDLLWSGTAYAEFKLWQQRYPGALTGTEQDFARSMADKARRRRRIVRVVGAAAVLGSLAVAVAIGLARQEAVLARDRAQAEALRAEASKVLTLAEMRLAEDPTEALALATASLELADSPEARVFALKALWEAPPAFEVANGDGQRILSFSPDGRQLATAGHSPEARVWREDGSGPLVLPGHVAMISPLGPLWASPSRLAVGYVMGGGDRAWVWSLPDGRLERTIEVRGAGLDDPVIVAGGRLFHLALRGQVRRDEPPDEVEIRSWSLPDGPPVELGRAPWPGWLGEDGETWFYGKGATLLSRALPVSPGSADRILGQHPPGIEWMATLPGHQVLTVNRDEERRLWRLEADRPPRVEVLAMPETAPGGVANVEDSGRWLTRKGDAGVKVWSRGTWTAARPVELRRAADWYMAGWTTSPGGEWLAAAITARLAFWPVQRPRPLVVDGYAYSFRPVIFSPDGRWLASLWAGGEVRLWPLAPGSTSPRVLDVPKGNLWVTNMAFDPQGRFLVGAGAEGRVFVVPLDGRPARRLEGFAVTHLLSSPAVSPSGRLVAAAFNYGTGEKSLRIWDLETGAVRSYDLSVGAQTTNPTGYEGGICNLAFAGDSTLYTAGAAGVRRWDLATGSQVVVVEAFGSCMSLRPADAPDKTLAVIGQFGADVCPTVALHDLVARSSRPLPALGSCVRTWDVDPAGTVIATGDQEGIVRVARVSGGEPHLLVGHKGVVESVAISPNLKWIASSGTDKTLRLWPMPDLSQPPLQTLPHGELVTKLKSLTNFRAVRDAKSPTGWTIELGPFPGWKEVPTW